MACKKTLTLIDMHSTKIFTLPCISTQNMLCKVMLTLLPYFVVFEKMFVIDVKRNKQTNKQTNVECFKAMNAQ